MAVNQFEELSEQIEAMQRELNNERFLELRIYRRDAYIYQLSSTVNHSIACWLSENHVPLRTLIDRGRNFMQEAPEGPSRYGWGAYYDLARTYFDTMEAALNILKKD
ncbi:hypothetical protein D1006_26140 [Burkholderia stabilis]|uniref:Uncharacterized protein n=1 Tax=Burkholderia stabilis TaxID=95485 RepID=A0A4Q2AGR6_9BURK|nr:hypothetical protein D1006_26140 [Burkholderia stabilis]